MTYLYEPYRHVNTEIIPRLRSGKWIVNPTLRISCSAGEVCGVYKQGIKEVQPAVAQGRENTGWGKGIKGKRGKRGEKIYLFSVFLRNICKPFINGLQA